MGTSETFWGLGIVMISGVLTATFPVPMKFSRVWRWENTWFVYASGELIIGMDPMDHERIWKRMWRQVDWVGRGGIAVLAVAAVDIGIWDLKARAANMPLHRFLGGARERKPRWAGPRSGTTRPGTTNGRNLILTTVAVVLRTPRTA